MVLFVHLLWPDETYEVCLYTACDQLVSSINGLRIVCLSRTAFLVVSFLGAGNSRMNVKGFVMTCVASLSNPKVDYLNQSLFCV